MNKTKFLLLSASAVLMLASCGKNTPESSSSSSEVSSSEATSSVESSMPVSSSADPLGKLEAALDAFPMNYTATWHTEASEDDPKLDPTLMVAEDLFANRYQTQITGYGKIARDDGKYHRFDHYREDNVDPWNGRYFYDYGRVDFYDEDIIERGRLINYFDVAKFEVTETGAYRSVDEDNITGFMNAVNTTFGYYMFGYGKGGVEITLTGEGAVNDIRYYGVSDDETGEIDLDALWATCSFSNVGSTSDDIFFDTVSSSTYDLTPRTEYLPRIGRDNKALYDGMEMEFTNMCISSIIGEEPEKAYVTWADSSYINFEIDDLSAFGDVYDNYTKSVSFTATIGTKDGHAVVKDVKNVAYEEDCLDVWPIEIEGGESYYYDFGDLEYGRSNNGTKLNFYNLNYEGGFKESSKGETFTMNFSYVFSGKKMMIPVTVTANASDDTRSNLADYFGGTSVGMAVNLYNTVFYYENGEIGCYLSEMSFVEDGFSFASLCAMTFGVEIPVYDGTLGFEFYFGMELPGDDDLTYPGVYAYGYLQEGKADVFVSEYADQLVANGYEYMTERYEEESDVIVYQYIKDGLVVIFTSPTVFEDGASYVLQVADLNNPIIPPSYDWPGTYSVVFNDTGETYELNIWGNGEATFNGDDITYGDYGNWIDFSYNGMYFQIQDNADGTYWGLCTTAETEYELTITKTVD